jgi:uncharacterized protein (UPF0333 family)
LGFPIDIEKKDKFSSNKTHAYEDILQRSNICDIPLDAGIKGFIQSGIYAKQSCRKQEVACPTGFEPVTLSLEG